MPDSRRRHAPIAPRRSTSPCPAAFPHATRRARIRRSLGSSRSARCPAPPARIVTEASVNRLGRSAMAGAAKLAWRDRWFTVRRIRARRAVDRRSHAQHRPVEPHPCPKPS
ncbi:hypothetical protein BSLA_01f4708 [Burkholderia stabilis]|nr:hypothetical protein BSLA_01f4708 [Burkholderia stabilis]